MPQRLQWHAGHHVGHGGNAPQYWQSCCGSLQFANNVELSSQAMPGSNSRGWLNLRVSAGSRLTLDDANCCDSPAACCISQASAGEGVSPCIFGWYWYMQRVTPSSLLHPVMILMMTGPQSHIKGGNCWGCKSLMASALCTSCSTLHLLASEGLGQHCQAAAEPCLVVMASTTCV